VRTDTHKLVYHHAPLSDPDYIAKLEAAPINSEHFSLYDADSAETEDLLSSGNGAAVAEALRAQLVAWRKSLAQGTHAVPQSAIDPMVADQMRKHGYWEAANNEGPPGGAPAAPPRGPRSPPPADNGATPRP
jgi:hypothetical protein